MDMPDCYENYPYWIVLIANLVQLSIYVIGAVIIGMVGPVWLLLFVAYIVFLELRLLKRSCVNCYYYGKRCAFGKGKLCSLFFKRGDPNRFVGRKITWKSILPDFMVSIIPFIVGIAILIMNFSLTVLILVISLFLLTSIGNGLVRGSLACKYCKQRELGCPAEQLFNKKVKK
jgi:hypothetical protein